MKVYSIVFVVLVIATSIVVYDVIGSTKADDPKVASFKTYLSSIDDEQLLKADTYFIFTPKTCLACMQRVLMNYGDLLAEPNVAILTSGAGTIPDDVSLLLEGKKNLYWDNTGALERRSFSKGGVVLVLAKNDTYRFFPLSPKNFGEVIDREIPTASVSIADRP